MQIPFYDTWVPLFVNRVLDKTRIGLGISPNPSNGNDDSPADMDEIYLDFVMFK